MSDGNVECRAEAVRNLANVIHQASVARMLDNASLVQDVLESDLQDEVLIEEMMTRLHPEWAGPAEILKTFGR